MEAAEILWTYFVVIGLVALSGLFSGLTLGLLSLDKTGLEIVIGGGSEQEQEWARKLVSLRADGNRLLCTLLVGNVVVNAYLSIFLANLYSSVGGLIASTALIVVFGEILPQATCSRHALAVGASATPLVHLFLVILSPIAVPLGRILDLLLGVDVGTVHTRTEMLHYMKVHMQRGELDNESGNVMRGALEMTHKPVVDVMTPLEDVYMLPESTNLSFQAIREIFEHGFSRVPVFRGERQNIVGLLFVKDLIFVDPEDETPIASLISIFERELQLVEEVDTLDDVLRIFKRGHGHLALVRVGNRSPPANASSLSSPSPTGAHTLHTTHHHSKRWPFERSPGLRNKKMRATNHPGAAVPSPSHAVSDEKPLSLPEAASHNNVVGIVTLEDIVEEIIGDEIIDETDVFVDVDKHVRVQGRSDFDFTKLRRLDARLVDERLTPEEIQAVTAHLCTNTQLSLSKSEMQNLIRRSRVVDMKRVSKNFAIPEKVSAKDVIYSKGEANSIATLVLSGKLTVLAGKDMFRSEAGPWTVLGADALLSEEGSFVPDFTAYIATSTMRCLYISRADYARAASKSDTENEAHENHVSRIRRYQSSTRSAHKERRMGIKEKRSQLAKKKYLFKPREVLQAAENEDDIVHRSPDAAAAVGALMDDYRRDNDCERPSYRSLGDTRSAASSLDFAGIINKCSHDEEDDLENPAS